MIKDFRDSNKDIIAMFRDTDVTHKFYIPDPIPTIFQINNNLSCEVRFSSNQEKINANPLVTYEVDEDFIRYIKINFSLPVKFITKDIRENKLYWKVFATDKVSGIRKVIRYGEIWLKGD